MQREWTCVKPAQACLELVQHSRGPDIIHGIPKPPCSILFLLLAGCSCRAVAPKGASHAQQGEGGKM